MDELARREAIRAAWTNFRARSADMDTATFAAALGILVGELLVEWPEQLGDRWLELVREEVERRRNEVS